MFIASRALLQRYAEFKRLLIFDIFLHAIPTRIIVPCNMQAKVVDTYVNISKISMTEAAEDLCLNSIQEGQPEDSIANVAVSCDITSQRRGHSSLNGVVTVICLDYCVLSKHCDACNYYPIKWRSFIIKGTALGLRQFYATENP